MKKLLNKNTSKRSRQKK